MKNKLVYVPIISLVMAIVTGAFALPSTVLAATYTVNTTDDTDDGTCDARHCSLREALRLAANHAGHDEVRFNIPGSGPHVITPIRFLQDIDGPCVTHSGMTYDTWWTNCFGDITIDGTSEPGYAGVPMIVLDGSRLGGGRDPVEDGRIIVGSHSTVGGISFVGWRTEVLYLEGDHITIEDNYIGVDPSGTAYGNYLGIRVHSENTIIRHNVISGNERGILQYSSPIPYVGTIIEGNYIGTDPSGTVAISNEVGIQIQNPTGIRRRELFSSNAVIGGGPDERNIISGNGVGIQIETDGNRILGNYIGTDITGGTALPNGIGILVSGSQNYIGEHNLISGNVYGLRIAGGDQTLVYHNSFGTDAGGSSPVPNQDAIDLFRTTVADISTNIIAYSTGNGIDVRGTSQSFIGYNEIYQNRNIGIMVRDDSVPSTEITIRENAIYNNGSDGIFVFESLQSDIIRNVIQNNGGDGIRLGTPGWEGFSTQIKISLNSIFHNSGLGIRLNTPEDNQGIDPPIITAALSTIDGTACPNCRVEIFLSDADSSGSGEGKQYLGGAYSHADGTFHAYLPRLRSCDQLTATATDELGNTSEFSRNYSVSLCWRIPPLAAWIWILGAAGAGVGLALLIVFRARRLRRQPGSVSTIALGLVGGLLGAGIAIGLLSLPFISIQWPQGQPGAQAPASGPSCGQFVNENLLQPPDGAVFEPGTDMLFELSPQPDPPGMQTRWFIEITGPGNQTVSKELTDVSISLSDLGFDPDRTGFYFWSLRGERSQTGSNKWDPLCTDSVRRMFRIATPQSVLDAETEMAAPNENEIPTPTLTPTQSAPTAALLQNANCRRGPGTDYDIVTYLPKGSNLPIVGRNPDQTWWQVTVPGGQTQCWVAGENLETSGDLSKVPIVESEALGCWVKQPQGPDKCVTPCPQGAQPGGACTP